MGIHGHKYVPDGPGQVVSSCQFAKEPMSDLTVKATPEAAKSKGFESPQEWYHFGERCREKCPMHIMNHYLSL